MNILYLTNLSGNLFAGPNNSVPAQINAQKKLDNVFWYNINKNKRQEWIEIGCKNLNDYPSGRLNGLPAPFNHPDLVIVEEFYCYPFSRIIRDVQKEKIPYIIVPRSELTEYAQNKKKIKKVIGNFAYFNAFFKKAIAIHYLSERERKESVKRWKNNSFIIPNGTNVNNNCSRKFINRNIRSVYIGRYEKYQKGLDILIEAIIEKKKMLQENDFSLDMYGVDQEGTISYIQEKIRKNGLEKLVIIHDAVFGDDKASVLMNSDIFIMTSRFEGMPMGMIEALSYGLPVIATIGTNMTEDIEEYHAGWTSDNTVEGVADCLEKMIDCKLDLGDMSKNAVRLSQKYSWDSIAEESHRTYEKIIYH